MTAASHPAGRGAQLQAQLKARWQADIAPRWQALSSRERLGVGAAMVALGILLVWFAAVAPALRSLRETPMQRDRLETQLAMMQRQAAEARALRGQPGINLAQAQSALTAATERLGSKARLVTTGDRATVTFTGIEGPALLAWLGEVRSGARARPVEAQLKRLGKAYDGTVTLSLAASAAIRPNATP